MPPKRTATRARSSQPREVEAARYGVAVRDEMPPLPSRVLTSYGSETTHQLINPRRGKRRELNEAIGEALQEAMAEPSDDEDESALDTSPAPAGSAPPPEPVVDPLPDMVRRPTDPDIPPEPEPDLPPIITAMAGIAQGPAPNARPTSQAGGTGAVSRAPQSNATPGRDPRARGALWIPRNFLWSQSSNRTYNVESSINRRARQDSPDAFASDLTLTPTPAPRGPGSSLPGSSLSIPRTVDFLVGQANKLFPGALGQRGPNGTATQPALSSSDSAPTPRRSARIAQDQTTSDPQPRQSVFGGLPPRLQAQLGGRSTANQGDPDHSDVSSNESSGRSGSPEDARQNLPRTSQNTRTQSPRARSPPRPSQNTRPRTRSSTTHKLEGLSDRLLHYAGSGLVVLTTLLAWWLAINIVTFKPPAFDWYGWDSVGYNLRQLMPFSIRHGLGGLDGNTSEYLDLVRDAHREIAKLQSSSKSHQDSLKQLGTMLPKVIHITPGRGGKPVISDDFWHALRDKVRLDDTVVQLELSRDGQKFTSGKHWEAVRNRMDAELGTGKMPKSWERWLQTNRVKVARILGVDDAPRQSAPATPATPVDENLDLLIRERLKSPELTKELLTREEFLRLLQPEFTAHRRQIQAEMKTALANHEKRVETIIQHTIDTKVRTGLSSDEIKALVDEAVLKAVREASLQAFANGQIMSTWDKDLRNRVNFFSVGTGATINVQESSPTYYPTKPQRLGTVNWFKSFRSAPPLGHGTVFQPWENSGDAWCGALGVDHSGRPMPAKLSIQLGKVITPEYVVVEHILPGATLSPDARPKEIEIWAYIDGVRQQKRLLDFAAAQFPKRQGTSLGFQPSSCGEGGCFLQIGGFEYDSSERQGGIYVHRLSEELANMGVTTDHVQLVARTNHGDALKTCLYRVRLYGNVVHGGGQGVELD